MGKRRNTAKTGDVALYKSRKSSGSAAMNSDDDVMYNEIDRYHNSRDKEDFVKLDADNNGDEDFDDGISGREAVLDLGAGESSSEEEDDESNEEEQDAVQDDDDSSTGEQSVSSESEGDQDFDQSDVRDWGKKKSDYYNGDTADIEIGQDEDDAFLEEEAAREIQSARYGNMDEGDFILSDAEEETIDIKKETKDKRIGEMMNTRDLSKLSRTDKRRLLQSHHPELLPLLSHFSEVVKEWNEVTHPVTEALLEGDEGTAEAVGATPTGLQYLSAKALLQSSTALNVAIYLLLKSEQSGLPDSDKLLALGVPTASDSEAIHSHPVMIRLQQWNAMAQKLEERVECKVEKISEQLENLLKATALMNSEDGTDDDSSIDRDGDVVASGGEVAMDEQIPSKMGPAEPNDLPVTVSHPSLDVDEDDDALGVLNEARFGLRRQELGSQIIAKKRRQRRGSPSDFGYDDEKDEGAQKAMQSLASTINSIEQKTATRSRKRLVAPTTETIDVLNEDNDALRQGLELMEAELGRTEGDGESDEMHSVPDHEIDDNAFYASVSKKSRTKKEFKKTLYQVAPKYPGMDAEVDGERAISKQIMKNRGLVAHKSKINRNPRVKKREQYRKALVRRKGNVREVRTDEVHKYGGEETGIKSSLSRSRKLGVR